MKVKGEFGTDIFKNIIISLDELERAARTLIGKPVKLDFENVGTVVDAEFKEGRVHYIAEVQTKQKKRFKVGAYCKNTKDGKMGGLVFYELFCNSKDFSLQRLKEMKQK